MAEEAKVVETKDLSKTEQFKEHLQLIVYQQLGVKVSKDKAWNLFKASIHGTVEFVEHIPSETVVDKETGEVIEKGANRLPLAGVGVFEILKTKPRGSKAGLDKDGNAVEGAEVWKFVPRFRFYPSNVIDKTIEKYFGLGGHEDLKEVHYGKFDPECSEIPTQAEKKAAERAERKAAKEAKKAAKEAKKDDAPSTEPAVDDFADMDDL